MLLLQYCPDSYPNMLKKVLRRCFRKRGSVGSLVFCSGASKSRGCSTKKKQKQQQHGFVCNFLFGQRMATLYRQWLVDTKWKMSKWRGYNLFMLFKSEVSGLQSRSNNSKCIYLHSCVKDVQVMGGFVNSPKTCTLQWLGFPWLLDAFFFFFSF